MNRRDFVASAATAAAEVSAQSPGQAPAVFELRYYRLRNGPENQRQRLPEGLTKIYVPAAQRSGAGECGVFLSSVGEQTPYVLLLSSYPSLAEMEKTQAKMNADADFQREAEAYFAQPGLPFTRVDIQLLRAFPGFPKIEVPPGGADRAPRVFELRTYESNTPYTLVRKVKMFEDGEIDIFRKSGLLPVFFGTTIAGSRLPNLTYMVAFDSMAAREQNWRTFGTSAEWKKLSATPGLSDAEVVSNISNWILTPVAGSLIR
jgi:hypothetical protein